MNHAVSVHPALETPPPTLTLEELRAIFASALDAILIADDSGRYVGANPAAGRLLGVAERDLVGRTIAELMGPGVDFAAAWSSFLQRGRDAGEIELQRGDGTLVQVEYRAISNVLPGRHLSILRDVSERRRAEEALRHGEQELTDFFENASIGLHWVGVDGSVLRVNRAELELLGYSREEYLGHHISEFHADAEVCEDILQRLQDGETLYNYRARLRHKDGSIRYVLLSSNVYRQDGEFVHTRCFTRDITDLAHAEERLQLLAAAGQLFSQSLDFEATLRNVARLAVPVLADWCVIDLIGEDGKLQRLATVHADPARQSLVEELERYPPIWEDDFGTAAVLRTGEPLLLAALPPGQIERIGRDAEHRRILEALEPQSALSVPLVARGRRLGTWGFVRSQGGRPYGESDLRLAETLARRAGLAIDNARLYRETELANRAKDRFLASLSHELRTPLTPVLMLVSRLEHRDGLSDETRRDLAVIRKNIELEARLIDDLLDLTRIARGKVELHREVTDVHALLRHALDICCAAAESEGRLTLETDLRAPEPRVWADGSRLTQVFWNLLTNAVKFTPAGGTVRVATRLVAAEGDAAAPGGEGGRLVIEIADTGVGIEPETLPRIFSAFEQGPSEDVRGRGGLGLGLAISKSILELLGGRLSAASGGRDRGATFTVEIPAVRLPSLPVAASAEAVPAKSAIQDRKSLRLLLVEDHADTAQAMAALLEERGYSVSVAGSLAAARQAVEENPAFDLLISDLGLPDGSGLELMSQLSSRSGLPGIALSGYGMEEDLRRSREAGFRAHLTKPVSLQALEAAVRATVGEP